MALSSHHHASVDLLINKPDIMADYNTTFDEKCSKFSCSRRTGYWSITLFLRFSYINAYILCESYKNQNHLDRSKFIQKVAFHLVELYLKRKLENSFLPRKLKLSICKILGVEEVNQSLECSKVRK